MIFGEPVRFDGRFGENMGQFLASINYASVTYKGSEIEIDGQITDNSEIRFNNSLSYNEYSKFLDSRYERAINELEITLFETYHKSEKLSLIIKIICEVDSFKSLLKKTEGGFKHKFFQFSNKSPEKKYLNNIINESSLQDYYFWMNHYLKKISKFLKNHKKSIESTNQIDFPLPPSMIPDKSTSTKEKPIANFEHLFQGNGFYILRKNFMPTQDDYEYGDMNYDPITETKSYLYQNNETGEYENSQTVFKDHYLKCLNTEYRISIKNIDDYISDQTNESKIRLYLKLTLSKLKYLLTAIEGNKEVNKYKVSINSINALIRFIYKKHSDFIPKKMIEEYANLGALKIGTNSQKTLPPPQATEVVALIDKTVSEEIIIKTNDEKIIKKSSTKVAKITFGYKTLETKKLENVLKELTLKTDLLVDSKTDCSELLNLLCSKNFLSENYKIYIGCETTQFSYIIKKLAPYFKNLNPATIESSNYFYTKKGTLLKAQNLYSNTIDNPKEKETIDNIIKLLQ